MLLDLPEDVQKKVLGLLPQQDLGRLGISCSALNRLTEPLLRRKFRCVSCGHALLQPKHILPMPAESRPRRNFFELGPHASHQLEVDCHRGAPNFHVIRHLSQTVFRNVRFPMADQVQAVRSLRCPQCHVFIGFRHDGVTGVAREYVHHDFVELVDHQGRLVDLRGNPVPVAQRVVRCSSASCAQVLFERDDMLPWSHVLSSSRLTDMDPYLEWDHSWAGTATASHPAFFVKRMKTQAFTMRHVRCEQLRQGLMEVGDVFCSGCDSHIGWKILAELPQSSSGLLYNYDQIGRFGIIRAAVTPSEPRYNV